jgi:hypothetical protein
MVLGLSIGGSSTQVNAAESVTDETSVVQIYTPDRAVRSGKYVYYALGNDGSGSLVKYNIKTKKSKTLYKKYGCKSLSVNGSYIYCCVDKYSGSDNSNYYIYRISKDGKKVKQLDKGYDPVVIGKYIYYVKTKNEKNSEYDTSIGIYRMKLDGSGKKKIWSAGEIYGIEGKTEDGKIVIAAIITGTKVSYNLLDPNTGADSSFDWYSGLTKVTTASTYFNTQISCNGDKIWYSYSGNTVYSQSVGSASSKKAASFSKGSIKKLIDLNGYFFVVTQNSNASKAYVYISKKNGSDKKLIYSFQMAGGSW